MFKTNEAVLMSNSGTVGFRGFAVLENTNSSSSSDSYYSEIERMRVLESEKFKNENVLTVRRENIFEDLMLCYKKRGTLLSRSVITFAGEEGIGDGVSKDAYSEFFDAFYRKLDGFTQKVPPSNMDEDGLQTAGKIITHAFVCYNVFPHQLSKNML